MRLAVFSLILFFCVQGAWSQANLQITLSEPSGGSLNGVEIFLEPENVLGVTNRNGSYTFENLKEGNKTVRIFKPDFSTVIREIDLKGDTAIYIQMQKLSELLEEVEITGESDRNFGLRMMRSIEGMAVYAGKKNEVLLPEKMEANKAANNARQVYARIPGVNVWESDGAGIQLGIGIRGLSPNRTANLNVRQNGYDISADALGYPESYYTPPLEAVERIEFVRGAASLQYGTQFGGMMNFRLKRGPEDKKIEFLTRQTGGSYGFFNSFNSVGGTVGKLNYYGFYQFKRGDGWRENSGFEVHTAHARLEYRFNDRWKIGGDITHMNYLAEQPGGLTDAEFEENPRQSTRDRNWFRVDWNIASLELDGNLSKRSAVNLRVFGLMASREALGFLGLPSRADDPSSPRDLISGDFDNIGAEFRYLYRYEIFNRRSILLTGVRAYNGLTSARQGAADASADPNFNFLNPSALEGSDYDFRNVNYAAFIENVFFVSNKLSITPGLRFEYIDTEADGYYTTLVRNQVGDILERTETAESRDRSRSFVLAGIGLSYKQSEAIEVYSNISQNYRAINFSDIRIQNPSLRIDPEIRDERGFNLDLGVRGGTRRIQFDLSSFYMAYQDRIGALQQRDPRTFQFYRLRDNIADSYAYGIESYVEFSILESDSNRFKPGISAFANGSFTEAIYINSSDRAVEGNQVELTPRYTVRSGLRTEWKNLSATVQMSHVAEQFTDATNAIETPSAINGLIPSYTVFDFSAAYKFKRFKIEFGVNNFTDERYFTRRAVGYPGPGILPSDGIGGYLTLQAKF